MEKNIFVVEVDMDHRAPEDIARDAALKINDIVNNLIEKQNQTRQEEKQDEKRDK